MRALSRPVDFPYVGVRAYAFDETDIFSGRDADAEQVCALVAGRALWRIILLHGQTGAGKSSFLKAGLVPQVMSPSMRTKVFQRDVEDEYSWFITSTAEPLRRLAEAAQHIAASHMAPDEMQDCLRRVGLPADDPSPVDALSHSPKLLARFFGEVAPKLDEPLLLILDQAEEVFTLRNDAQADEFRTSYFDFLAEYCQQRSWIQILISMRTEFYGRFDSELRKRLGPQMPVAPYYLEPLGQQTLVTVIEEPLERSYATAEGRRYCIALEAGLAEAIASAVLKKFPGSGALTCLQVVCSRLCEQGLAEVAGHALAPSDQALRVQVTHAMFAALGPIEHLLEDVVDQAIGAFCDPRDLLVSDALLLWSKTKDALGTLVTQQQGGAPTTKFIRRESFEAELTASFMTGPVKTHRNALRLTLMIFGPKLHEKLLTEAMWPSLVKALVQHLLSPSVRVLRLVRLVEQGAGGAVTYLALGHDILSVGISEANAREAALREREAVQGRRFIQVVAAVPIITGLVVAALSYYTGLAHGSASPEWSRLALRALGGAIASLYVALFLWFGYEILRPSKRKTVFDVVREHVGPPRSTKKYGAWLALLLQPIGFALERVSATGLLFRELSANGRRWMDDKGQAVFLRGDRY